MGRRNFGFHRGKPGGSPTMQQKITAISVMLVDIAHLFRIMQGKA
jgi:hypothetical protein